jgi:ribosomal protein S12 methylthiotransferase accessory factor
MIMQIGFPGGVKVEASFRDRSILTDQPEKNGGDNAGPQPFDTFLASIGTCAGFYALRFCQKREIDTEGLGIELETIRDPETKRLSRINLHLALPPSFPDKYEKAIVRAIDQCAVKKAIQDPPIIDTVIAA